MINVPKPMAEPISIKELVSNTDQIIGNIKSRNENELILVDSNIISPNDLLPKTYHCKRYEDLDVDKLKDTIQGLDFGLKVLSDKNVYVPEGVSREAELFFSLVCGKSEFYDKISKLEGKKILGSGRWERYYYSKLEGLAEELYKKSLGKISKPSNRQAYENLLEVAGTFKDIFNLMPVKRAEHAHKKNGRMFKSAEELAALALYQSFIEESPCSIISTSTGVYRILKHCIIFMKSDKATKSGEYEYKEILEKNIINLYSPVDSEGFLEPRFSSKSLPSYVPEQYLSRLF